VSPVAYLFRWFDKQVVFSGRIPAAIDRATLPEFWHDLAEPQGNAREYMNSLRILSDLRPDLYLPAIPRNSPSANLYGDMWNELIGTNRQAAARR
jgi:hypothetical protein